MLKIENLHVSYGGIQALRGISLEVPDGKIVTLIGANGAGKSTTLRTITGLVKASSGSIQWNGEELLGKSIDKIVGSGIAMSPEGRRVFADMSVVENLRIGAYLRTDKAEIEKDVQWVYSLFPRLEERSWQLAGTLSGGRGPGADVPPQADDAGRTLSGPGALGGAGHFLHHQGNQQAGRDGAPH